MRNIGDKVAFHLDGARYGEGVIQSPLPNAENASFEIKLTTPCKEFPVGHVIMVDESEFVDHEPSLVLVDAYVVPAGWTDVPTIAKKTVCSVCSGDTFRLFVIKGHNHILCANPVCQESFCQGGCE